jgi:predicted hydrocarbon binding protein
MENSQQVLDLIRAESVLIDRGIIGELYETGLKFLGIGIGGILYTAGKKGGARGAQLLHKRLGLSGDELLEAALLAFTEAHWGIGELLRDNGTLKIQVRDSVLASSVPRQKKPICHPLAGYIAGFLEEAWKKSVKVKEVKCIAAGDPHCLFEVE